MICPRPLDDGGFKLIKLYFLLLLPAYKFIPVTVFIYGYCLQINKERYNYINNKNILYFNI